jgi:hypothetical protein|tara:strand:- start:5818 stop:6408 length:591 start_codon:yes stop_codon:yes gene_type:complete
VASVVTIAFIPREIACDSCLALALVAAAPKNEPTSKGQHHAPTSDGADANTAIAVSTRCDDIAFATLRTLRAPVAARARLETYSSSDRADSESLDPSSFARATSRGATQDAQRASSSSSPFSRSSGASSARGIDRRRASPSAGSHSSPPSDVERTRRARRDGDGRARARRRRERQVRAVLPRASERDGARGAVFRS